MNAEQIRALVVNNGTYSGFCPDNVTEQIAVAQLEILNEITAQMAEANQLARLRLQIEYIGPRREFIDQLKTAEIREEAEAI